MKIIVYEKKDKNYLRYEELVVDGKERTHVGPLCECPEDAIIGRSLVSCTDIANYMKEAYDAGKRGEEFGIERLLMED